MAGIQSALSHLQHSSVLSTVSVERPLASVTMTASNVTYLGEAVDFSLTLEDVDTTSPQISVQVSTGPVHSL